ncbi:hypothetical protein EBU24_02975 [bacterium]|nr:hypothetical protein [bacterium]
MPIPKRNQNEDNQKFVSRCMGNETMKKEYPDSKQRVAICLGQTRKSKSTLLDQVLEILGFTVSFDCEECGDFEELTLSNLIIPTDDQYIDVGEETEEYDISHMTASEYQGRKVTLNKPFRTPNGPKKSAVYVKNDKGKVVIVRFGDPNMKIKKNIPSRRKSFRARHNCDNPGPKWKARYWSCKAW